MLLYLLRGDSAFSMLKPVRNDPWGAPGGRVVASPWKEIEFTQSEGDEDFIAADCLTMNTGADGFLLSDYACQSLASLLDGTGQLLPVRVMDQHYWWHNCTALVEALDVKKTDADWSSVGGRWGSFKWISIARSLAFRPSRIKQAPVLFRIPEFPQGMLFAQSDLRNAVQNYGLTGFRFDLVWSADLGGVLNPPGLGFNGMFAPVSSHDLQEKQRAARKSIADRTQKTGI